jgi:hypothetical protein
MGGPPSPTLSEVSTFSGASFFSTSTKSSLGTSYSDVYTNEYGYPTPQASAKRARPFARPLQRLPTADSIPVHPSELDQVPTCLPDSPTPFRAVSFGLPQLASVPAPTSDMDLDLASPFHDAFQEKHGWPVSAA